MRISDWSSDVCSSDLRVRRPRPHHGGGRVPDNDAVTITKTASAADLSIAPLDKIDEPLSLTNLHNAIDARLPRLDLPELILEMHARTGFGAAFTHASEGNARAEDIATRPEERRGGKECVSTCRSRGS